MVRKQGRANDLEGDRECFSQQAEVESFLTCLLKRGLSPFPFAPDSLFIDEDPRSFSRGIFTAEDSFITPGEPAH